MRAGVRYDSSPHMSGNPLSRRLAVLAAGMLGACSAPRSAPALPAPAPTNVEHASDAHGQAAAPRLARVGVIGASASSGFGIPVVGLADALDEMIVGEHEPVRAFAEPMFFLTPDASAERQVQAVLEQDPTLVVAVDFLFWFTYGLVAEEGDRLELLERGLALLDRIECPLVLAAVPEMREAIGKMLIAAQVPDPDTLAAAAERIHAWARERPDVLVLPLPELVALLRQGKPFVIGGEAWPTTPDVPLLQPDDLHPTIDGLAGLAANIAELLVSRGVVPPSSLRIDPSATARGLRARVARSRS